MDHEAIVSANEEKTCPTIMSSLIVVPRCPYCVVMRDLERVGMAGPPPPGGGRVGPEERTQ